MLSQIQSALRASISADARRVGPFLIHFDAHDDHPFRNYAIPDDGAQPTPEQVADLVAEFVQQARKPRLEYLSPAPAVDAALTAAGFTVDLRMPLMTLTRAELRVPPTPAGVTLSVATTDDDLHAAALVQNIAYAGTDTVTAADLDRLRSTISRGGVVVLARSEGTPAGAGLFTAPQQGLTQIAAIAVTPEFRRRGIASAVSADLTARAFASGLKPYLETETHNERRVYGPLGYTVVGELVAISLSQ